MKIVREVKTQAKHPLAIGTLGAFLCASLIQLVFTPQDTVGSHLPHQAIAALDALLLLATMLGLVGSLIDDVLLGFFFELAGWCGVTFVFGTYGWAALTNSPNTEGRLNSAWLWVFVFCAIWRSAQIIRAILRLRGIKEHKIDPIPEEPS